MGLGVASSYCVVLYRYIGQQHTVTCGKVKGGRFPAGRVSGVNVLRADQQSHPGHVAVLAGLEELSQGVVGRQGDGLCVDRTQGPPCRHLVTTSFSYCTGTKLALSGSEHQHQRIQLLQEGSN